jgi:hypothetical protein
VARDLKAARGMKVNVLIPTVVVAAAGCAGPSWDHAAELAVAETPTGAVTARLADDHQLYVREPGEVEATLGEPAPGNIAIASGGASVLIARTETTPEATGTTLSVRTLDGAPAGVRDGFMLSFPAALPHAGEYVLAWATPSTLELGRVSAAGTPIELVPDPIDSAFLVGLAVAGDGAIVAHRGGAAEGYAGIYARVLDAQARPGPAVPLVLDADTGTITGGEHGVVLAWVTQTAQSFEYVLRAQRFDPTLAPLGSPVELARFALDAPFAPRLAMAGDAARFAVAWTAGSAAEPTVSARVVSALEAEPGPIVPLGSGYFPVLTARGSTLHAHWLADDDAVRSTDLD